jgi:DNA end-binding protein Ku
VARGASSRQGVGCPDAGGPHLPRLGQLRLTDDPPRADEEDEDMARPTWRGAISFGLVSVPVQLFTAVRSHDVRFRQLHRETKRPVRQKRVDAETGDEVAYEDIVKGYELGEGRFVVVDTDELAELDPKASRVIDIHDYVDQAQIDPIHYDRAYYLAPDGETAAKPYKLLAAAMERSGKVAIAEFVMRGKSYLAAVRARDGLLLLSTMHYGDEVADPAELAPEALDLDGVEVRDRELVMAEQLIASMVTDFEPDAYRDRHRERLVEYLEAKAAGEQFELPSDDGDGGEVIDLMAALERSLERARGDDGGGADGSGAADADEDAATDGDAAAVTSTPPSGSSPDYAAMTRSQLYDLAQERELPGRSGMSKAELVEALQASDVSAGAA